ncbi:hypothetical protein GCM10008171_02370 [Methylopila jiangsuensis]|uniref:Putative aliphatic sulfonates-binding protein n=1 Tax=Methylopila jiangsuensis TaxID=586230 RepID=A0A9W6N290_9HYPH|nr:aliphatic sulfonate ABC transporter substrate-binding protein [Methylopila jiangsuensis]MDR6287402.1 sulfonate transport system substrate-binding protein [Methylopila jiangsuensis]GLK74983.1 hypothetical protein GCM10008171_02370 [Methylopila jiangsuensis]
MTHLASVLRPFSRRAALAVLSLGLSGLTLAGAQAAETLRVGYQRSSTLITLLKSSGELEAALAKRNVTVSWHEFTSGLPLLEALNTGNVDVSADVADTVPVFAQAAGAKLTYVAEEAASPAAQAILVPAASPITSVAELKGRRIAVTKGAGSHYLLLAALAKAGLSIKDVNPAYLPPADGRAALVGGNVDALVVWDPFLASTQAQSGARVLQNGDGLSSYKRYYLTTDAFAKDHAPVLETIVAQLKAKGAWVKAHPQEAAAQLAAIWKIDAAIIEQGNARRSYQVATVTRDGLAEQQKIADAFFAEGLFPKPIVTADTPVWQPASQ